MKRIAVVGAGKIGHMISDMLVKSGDYQVAVIDKSAGQLERLKAVTPVECLAIDVSDPSAVATALRVMTALVMRPRLSQSLRRKNHLIRFLRSRIRKAMPRRSQLL